MFISRRCNSPDFIFQPNKLGRTHGIYGHWPTFYKCNGPADQAMWDKYGEGISACSKPKRHIKDVGYVRLMLPNGNLTFWYMGNPYRHKIIEWFGKK